MEFDVNALLSKDKKTIEDKPKEVHKKSNMGRPKKDEKERKSERVVCYLTISELEQLKELSDEQDLTHSNYVRKVLIEHLK